MDKKLIEIFKTSGLNELIFELEKRLNTSDKRCMDLIKKIELLELAIDFNSSIYLQSGAVIAPARKISNFSWKADDLCEYITGLESVTYESSKPTRWASSLVKQIKIILPIIRSGDLNFKIIFNSGVNDKVMSSVSIYLGGRKIINNFTKTNDGYVCSFPIDPLDTNENTVITIDYKDYLEGKIRHTVGVCSMEVA